MTLNFTPQGMLKRFDFSQTLEMSARSARVGKFGTLVGLYAAQAALGKVAARGDRLERLSYFTKNVSKWSRRGLEVMNVQVEVKGLDQDLMANRNFLMVGNHMSYVDVMVTSSVLPTVFVTSVEMGETAFLGQMAELGGSIFVERRSRASIGHDMGVMARTLKAGHNVMIYPEGTSSNGESLLPFKKSLLLSAVEAGVDILPVVLKYKEIGGRPFGPETRDRVCWYGDMTFTPHILGLLKGEEIKAELSFLPPIKVSKESTRAELAEQTYQAIYNAYHGVDTDDGGRNSGSEFTMNSVLGSMPAVSQEA